MEKNNMTFCSQTDTEVLVQLVEYMMNTHNCDLYTAVQLALKNVIGAYAIAILDKSHPDQLVCARKGSPLIIGLGKSANGRAEFFLGSDATPIIEYTNKVIYLKDEEIAIMDRSGHIDITNLSNVKQTPQLVTLQMNLDQLEKGGYPHFMLKEIWEQPNALRTCIRGRLNMADKDVLLSGIIDHKEKFLNCSRIIICACGTSWHSALIGKYFIEEAAQIPVEVEYASARSTLREVSPVARSTVNRIMSFELASTPVIRNLPLQVPSIFISPLSKMGFPVPSFNRGI